MSVTEQSAGGSNEVVIVDAARSAVGRKNGGLATVHPTDILGQVFTGLLKRNSLDSAEVDQIIGGCINKLGAQGMNVTRTAWLAHGGALTTCLLYTSPSPRDKRQSRMPSSA